MNSLDYFSLQNMVYTIFLISLTCLENEVHLFTVDKADFMLIKPFLKLP